MWFVKKEFEHELNQLDETNLAGTLDRMVREDKAIVPPVVNKSFYSLKIIEKYQNDPNYIMVQYSVKW